MNERNQGEESLNLTVLPGRFAVCRLEPGDEIPAWARAGPFSSVTRTADELSVVAPEDAVPQDVRSERGWRCLKVDGVLDFALTGILVSLAAPLAAAGVPAFAVSTYDTDHLLVREADLPTALDALSARGHRVEISD